MSETKPAEYYQGVNRLLMDCIDHTALSVVEVGCGEGRLGGALRQRDKWVEVIGLEIDPDVSEIARSNLSRVFNVDVEKDQPDIDPGSIDVILYGDVLEHLRDPRAVLEKQRQWLSDYGEVLMCVPNVQHYSVIKQLLRGDWQYQQMGLLDATHLRFFTFASIVKLLFDAGYMPEFVQAARQVVPAGIVESIGPLAKHLGADLVRLHEQMSAYQYIFRGTPMVRSKLGSEAFPISFVVCSNDQDLLENNLLASTCLQSPSSIHEVLIYQNCESAAEGLNQGIREAKNEIVVCVHQDVYLPRGWDMWLADQIAMLPNKDFGVLGVWGTVGTREGRGKVFDRTTSLRRLDGWGPQEVKTLDELLLVVRKSAPMRFDEQLGWHLYGADICVEAHKRGYFVGAIDAPCFHNSLQAELPKDFLESAKTLGSKWNATCPIHTSCGDIDQRGVIQ